MTLKKRIVAINNKINPDPKEEARQQELKGKIEAARFRAGIQGGNRPIVDVPPGAGLADKLAMARRAHTAKEVKR